MPPLSCPPVGPFQLSFCPLVPVAAYKMLIRHLFVGCHSIMPLHFLCAYSILSPLPLATSP